eukprot:gene9629-9789_t
MGASRLSYLAIAALTAVSLVGFSDLFTYSTPDPFLGSALAAQGATAAQVMLSYGINGAAATITGVLVLLCQSHSMVAGLALATKWWLVIGAQGLTAAASLLMVMLPNFSIITAGRALHGFSGALYMIYCLVLLVEMSPRNHLPLGIASLSAGMMAGDNVGPVTGALVYDRGGLKGAFSLMLAVDVLVLLVAVLMKEPHINDALPKEIHPITIHVACQASVTPRAPHGCAARECEAIILDMSLSAAEGPPSRPVSISNAPATSPGATKPDRLDLAALWLILKDPVIFCQCTFLFLEQVMRSALTVVLPATMGSPTWIVGLVYIPNVVGAIVSPFVLDAIISRKPGVPTHAFSVLLSVIMGVTATLAILASSNIPALCVLLFLYGASQAAVETLVYLHVAHRLDRIEVASAAPVSMCMYYLAQTAGAGIGSLTGGGLQHQAFTVQLGVMGGGCGFAAGFGVLLGALSNQKWRCFR